MNDNSLGGTRHAVKAGSAADLHRDLRNALEAVRLQPQDGAALSRLGQCQMSLLLLPEAVVTFEKAYSLLPSSPDAAQNLGKVLFMLGRLEQSANAFKDALRLSPQSAEAHLGLAQTRMAQGRFDEAAEPAADAVRLAPTSAIARVFLSQVLLHQGLYGEAEVQAKEATELDPADGLAQSVLGTALQSQGRLEEADTHFLKSIEIQPHQGNAYLALVQDRKITEQDRELVQRMEELSQDISLPLSELQMLHYGVGRAYEQLKEYERSMAAYDRANAAAQELKFGERPFDRNQYKAMRERVKSFFTRELFESVRSAGLENRTPIFIVGMMRSGTTLMEQILSSHPEVEAGGELTFWMEKGSYEFDPQTGTLGPRQIAEIGAEYLDLLDKLAPGAKHVTDKMPANDLVLGFIHAAFPNAPILAMKRNPADNCFSIYSTPNRALFEFGHERSNIAFAYKAHRDLMRHWRSVLPPDRLMEVSYEELIEDQERMTRQVIEFCGLPWSDLCLTPERNERNVATPSVRQVRQPVYKTSMERFRNFEPWIPEFTALLDG